ncbi:MAG: hypothetical protein WC503_03610 [Candidatus Shapirobacteria bacterium]
MKNTIIGVILGIIIAMWAFYIYIKTPVSKDALTSNISTPTIVINSSEELSVTPVSEEISIKQSLAKKYNLPLNQISVIFKGITSSQAAGTVSFSGEGGWFLTVKKNDAWEIIADGNGTVSCETIAPYNFPISLVSECVDKNGKLQNL